MTAPVRNPFRMRNLLGGALALGILAGIWLGDLFRGFGLGPGQGTGQPKGSAGVTSPLDKSPGDSAADLVGVNTGDEPGDEPGAGPTSDGLVHVRIDDRKYFLIQDGKQYAIGVEALVQRIEQTEPNADGLRAVIERTASSRVSAEVRLFELLKEAGVPVNSIYLPPHAVP